MPFKDPDNRRAHNRVYRRRTPLSPQAELFRNTPEDPRHGTLNGYTNKACRCEFCTECNTLYNAIVKDQKRFKAKGYRIMSDYELQVKLARLRELELNTYERTK